MNIILVLLIAVTLISLGASYGKIFADLENTYSNEKCGVSIQYPKDWVATESNFIDDKIKTIADFQSEDDDIYTLSFSIENFGLAKKSMSEISKWFRDYWVTSPESGIVSSGISEINGFPTYQIIYYDGLEGKYELQDEKSHTMEVLIIAFGREYVLLYEAPNKTDFDKYSSIVEEMANSIKITKPNFQGINCSDQDLPTKKDNIVNLASRDSNIQDNTIPTNVIDDIMRKHQQFAYTLGGPSSDIQITDDSQGYYQKFSKGDIFWHPKFGVHEVHGGISDKWENLGYEKGALGYPISDEYGIGGGRQSDFENGHISWSEENGEITVFMGKK